MTLEIAFLVQVRESTNFPRFDGVHETVRKPSSIVGMDEGVCARQALNGRGATMSTINALVQHNAPSAWDDLRPATIAGGATALVTAGLALGFMRKTSAPAIVAGIAGGVATAALAIKGFAALNSHKVDPVKIGSYTYAPNWEDSRPTVDVYATGVTGAKDGYATLSEALKAAKKHEGVAIARDNNRVYLLETDAASFELGWDTPVTGMMPFPPGPQDKISIVGESDETYKATNKDIVGFSTNVFKNSLDGWRYDSPFFFHAGPAAGADEKKALAAANPKDPEWVNLYPVRETSSSYNY